MVSELWQLLWPGKRLLPCMGSLALVVNPVRILVAVVHYWDPEGNGQHGSLRPDPRPRIEAFQQQLLPPAGARQAQLNIVNGGRPANAVAARVDIEVITDGDHHVLDLLDPPYRGLFQMVVAEPASPKHLGLRPNASSQVGWIRSMTFMLISRMI